MAHDAVQDLLDKVWFGGLEPVTSSLTVSFLNIQKLQQSLRSDLRIIFSDRSLLPLANFGTLANDGLER